MDRTCLVPYKLFSSFVTTAFFKIGKKVLKTIYDQEPNCIISQPSLLSDPRKSYLLFLFHSFLTFSFYYFRSIKILFSLLFQLVFLPILNYFSYKMHRSNSNLSLLG